MKLFNTLTRKKETFRPLEEGRVSMYHCGPTVYDHVQIGNLRAFLTADILRRTMEYCGFRVRQVMNITDVDDKTIRRAKEKGQTLDELAEYYERSFFDDIDALHIKRAHVVSRATEHIEEMAALIGKLLENGHAYRGEDGSVYYDISSFGGYGSFAGIDTTGARPGARALDDEYAKDDVQDFALWKSWKPEDGDVFWETALGKGRPGWHIECSAMSMKYLGEEFDIHTGGVDLIFPHHTNEIAQSAAATGKSFARAWLHNEHVAVEGKKMAKSEGNSITLSDIIEKGRNPLAYRYWLLTAHYRTLVNFTWEALEAAENALDRLIERYRELGGGPAGEVSIPHAAAFKKALEDDLNTPQALAALWDIVKDTAAEPAAKKATITDFDRVLGLGLGELEETAIPQEVSDLVARREIARKKNDWEKADALREEVLKFGYTIKDTPVGPIMIPLKDSGEREK